MTCLDTLKTPVIWLIAVGISVCSGSVFAQQQEEIYEEAGAHTFTVPQGVTEITVEAWGGGGRGGPRVGNNSGSSGGGGGGAYARSELDVAPGEVYEVIVGGGSDQNQSGDSSSFGNPVLVRAAGGASVGNNQQAGASGGAEADSVGDIVRAGGDGADGGDSIFGFAGDGGGGGSSAGPDASGNDATGSSGAIAPEGGGDGGDGGSTFFAGSDPGDQGETPGGGGGGATREPIGGAPTEGGAGADGQVRITYDGPALSAGLLIAYWFDEDWTDDGSIIPDQSGEGRDGFSSGADYAPAGNESARPGSPGTCGFAQIEGPDNVIAPVDDAVNESDSFSATFWMRMDENNQNDETPSIMAVGELDGFFANRAEVLADFRGQDRDLIFFVRQGQPNNPRERTLRWETSAGDANDPFGGEWVHIGVRHDMDSRLLEIYANGDLVASANYGNQGPDRLVEASDDIQIGGFTGGTAPATLDFDEFRFYSDVLSGSDIVNLFLQERPCATGQAGFEISLPGSASVCEAAPVTLTVVNDDGDPVVDYSNTIELETSSSAGTWELSSGNGTFVPSGSDDGQAEYTFDVADDGTVELLLANHLADTLTIGVTDGEISGTSAPLPFRENAFLVSLDEDPLSSDVIAGRPHEVQVKAVGLGDDDQCGLIEEYDGTFDLEAWVARGEDDPGGEEPALNGESLPGDAPDSTNVSIDFNGGEAGASLHAFDVGQYRLQLLDQSPDRDFIVDEEGNPRPVSGISPTLRPRPFGFDVEVPENQAGGTPDEAAFTAAGRPFEVELRAVLWSEATDAEEDGVPDGHGDPNATPVDLSGNGIVPSFALDENRMELRASTLLDTDEFANPSLLLPDTIPGFNGGSAEVSDVRYPEVGAIRMEAVFEGSYLGAPVNLIGAVSPVGRFHPELFTVQAMDGSFEPECNGFVYSGQEYGYDAVPELEITPRRYDGSGSGPPVSNYRGDWQLLTVDDVGPPDFPDEDGTTELEVGVNIDSGGSMLEPEGSGVMVYFFGDDGYTYDKEDENARQEPFPSDLTIQITSIDDGDAQLAPDQAPVEITPVGVEIRYGRLRLENAYGPETLPLSIPVRAEYWNGARFVLNADEDGFMSDECWQYNPSGVEVNDSVVELEPGTVAENISADDTFGLDMGEPDPGLDTGNPDEQDGRIWLRALSDELGPGDDNRELVRFVVPAWLRDDFSGDGELQNPEATATFGVYRGHDRIIHWREVR